MMLNFRFKKYLATFLIIFANSIGAEEVLITNANIYDGKSDDPFISNIYIKNGKIKNI